MSSPTGAKRKTVAPERGNVAGNAIAIRAKKEVRVSVLGHIQAVPLHRSTAFWERGSGSRQ